MIQDKPEIDDHGFSAVNKIGIKIRKEKINQKNSISQSLFQDF